MATGMEKARVERLAYAYRIDRLWPARVSRLSLYVAMQLARRLPFWTDAAGWSARRLPWLHKPLSVAYGRSRRPPAGRPHRAIDPIGPQQRRALRRLALLRGSGGPG